MPKEPADTVQVSVRINIAWLPELDTIAKRLSRPGLDISRTEALRAAIARGIQELLEETAPPAAPPSRPGPKRKR